MIVVNSKVSYPEKVDIDGLESKWSTVWEESGVFRFDPTIPKEKIYSIDTPPPTVSGSLHIGHVFSYTHCDIVARYKRMQGFEVFYPMGFDDNGVPTERRVQNYYSVKCDPTLPYDQNLDITTTTEGSVRAVSRRNFIDLCTKLTQHDEKIFEDLWRKLGLSVDWTITYTTVGETARRVSQRSFLEGVASDEIYSTDAPTLWDVDFQTAISQAELEDREIEGTYFRIAFKLQNGTALEIETSRPELIPSCVAIVVNPDDERYASLVGTVAYSPLFEVPLTIYAHPLAEAGKGTGVAMVSTFGDLTDVTWWRDLSLPLRHLVGRDGRLSLEAPFGEVGWPSKSPELACKHYQALAGLPTKKAREAIIMLLKENELLIGEPKKVRHNVKFYEKGDRPLEVVTSRQWYVRTIKHTERLLQLGKELNFVPATMRVRYENWVSGLNSDWNISRQRYFGIPIPVWYQLDGHGNVLFDKPILPDSDRLPVDPQTDTPPGYDESQRDQALGFSADLDVMDTWATSSLSPLLAIESSPIPIKSGRCFPMDLRPQGQDIIRTWLFYTILRSEIEFHRLPWSNTLISGFVLDPDRKKMSKSKGNVVTPMPLVDKFGADALRYWSAYGRPGVDTAADESQMKTGRRLAIKIGNASKFVLSVARLASKANEDQMRPTYLNPIDVDLFIGLREVITNATVALDRYDYTKALEVIEAFFWGYCDDYIELVKVRAYGENFSSFESNQSLSARYSLLKSLSIILRFFAPFQPFITEEVWSWWQLGSIHRAPWPTVEEIDEIISGADTLSSDTRPYIVAADVLAEIRKAKSIAKVSMKTPVKSLLISAESSFINGFELVRQDVVDAGVVKDITSAVGPRSIQVHLA